MGFTLYNLEDVLAANGTITVSYDTPILEMTGYPQAHFIEQIEDCPRLKEVLTQALK